MIASHSSGAALYSMSFAAIIVKLAALIISKRTILQR